MNIARRVYLYLVAFISLQMLLAGATNLLRLVAQAALGTTGRLVGADTADRDQLSLWGAILIVGGLVWAIHWFLAQRVATGDGAGAIDERRSVLRKLFLYATLLVALGRAFFATAGLIREALLALFGRGGDLRDAATAQLPIIAVYGLAWAYHWTIRRADEAVAPEVGPAATVRRWYAYLACFGALSVGMWAGAEVARGLWRLLTAAPALTVGGTSLAGIALAGSGAWLIVGLGCWAAHWLPTQHLIARSPDEQGSVLRKVYLYGLIFQTVAVTLTNLARFLYKLLQLALGGDERAGLAAGDSLLTAAGMPLLAAAVYGLFWAYHRQVIAGDARLVAEQPRQAAIRRFYHSLVALASLALLTGGLADLLRLLLDLWLGGRATSALSRAGWADQISLAATLLLVGAPVWAFQWRKLQRRALADDGAAERESPVRRIYLLLILFCAVTALLGGVATFLYQLFRNVGTTFGGSAISALSWGAGASVTAAIFLAYHLRVLLADQRHRADRPTSAPAAPAGDGAAPAGYVLIVQGGAGAVAALRAHLPADCRLEEYAVDATTLAGTRDLLSSRAAAAQSPPRRTGHAGPAPEQSPPT